MRIRSIKFQLWISEVESERLTRNALKSKMTKSNYIRSLINGYEPKEVPPYEYFEVLKELRAIGRNINQIAHKANVNGSIDAAGYREDCEELARLADELSQVFLPKRLR